MSSRNRSWGLVIVVVVALGGAATAAAQEPEKTFAERAKEYWEKVVSGMESGAKSAGDEYHKLKAEAAEATGPAREKLGAKMEAASKKWASAREKLSTGLEKHAHAVREEIKGLEEKAEKKSGPAREKLVAEKEKLHEHWVAAREKIGAAYTSNMKAAHDEYAHLKEHAGKATEDTKAKLAPRMERLKAEWSKDREKLGNYLKDDLKRTEEDMHKLGDATSEAGKAAKEKLTKKYHELRGKSDALAAENSLDDAK